jgi:hypothetical protein
LNKNIRKDPIIYLEAGSNPASTLSIPLVLTKEWAVGLQTPRFNGLERKKGYPPKEEEVLYE